jgi:hypothetical protein
MKAIVTGTMGQCKIIAIATAIPSIQSGIKKKSIMDSKKNCIFSFKFENYVQNHNPTCSNSEYFFASPIRA